jgi:hypothetical protein
MKHFYVTGNIFCAECGNFMVPERHALANGGLDGRVTVRGHKPECSLFGKAAIVELPRVEAIEIAGEAAAGK